MLIFITSVEVLWHFAYEIKENVVMKKLAIFGKSLVLSAALVLSFGTVESFAANSNNVSFETFITSVKAGEFVLSDKIEDEFLTAVNSGNKDRAMEIYRDYFDGDNNDDVAYVVGEPTEQAPAEVKAETSEESKEVSAAEAEPTVAPTVAPKATPKAVVEESDGDDVGAPDEVYSMQPVGSEDMGDVGAADSDNHGLSEADYICLCKMVQAEAGCEDIEGKMMVASVIMNRVGSYKWPMSVSAVVSQPGQFSPYANGRFATAVPSAETMRAVNRVLDGENLAVNVLYFKSISSAQIWSNKILAFQHGRHLFYY